MATYKTTSLKDTPPPPAARAVLDADADLPMCATCATQYPAKRDDCPICLDPRQYEGLGGQAWTTLGSLAAKHTNDILTDPDDPRVGLIRTEPPFAINQTPFLLETARGSYIWDCSGVITAPLVAYLLGLKTPLKAMAISHPHFFSTSLTWSRALGIPLYINAADKEWFQRASDIKDSDKVVFWRDKAELGPGVSVVECGGHFPGSCVLHWDRAAEPESDKTLPRTGLLLTADTIMVQPTQNGMTFMWSYPNMIPMHPTSVLGIQRALSHLDFDVVSSTWPDRMVRSGGRAVFDRSVPYYLKQVGWRAEGDGIVPLK